jgi:hypothetical protein
VAGLIQQLKPKRLAVTVLIATTLLFVFLFARWDAMDSPRRDFQSFFEASQHLTDNPYLNIGMRNPPWSLPLLLPLRPFNYPSAFGLWTLFTFISVPYCTWFFWKLLNPQQPAWAAAILALTFGPTINLLFLGQLTATVLLGFVLFTEFESRRLDWLAGATLVLILVKPHVAALIAVAIFIWAINAARWPILLGALCSLLIGSSAALMLDPHVFSQYVAYSHDFTRTTNFFPTIGGVLIALSGNRLLGLIPEVIGLVWTIAYFWRHRHVWDWRYHGALVLATSVFCSYYAFPYDEIVALPALVVALACGNKRAVCLGLLIVDVAYYRYMSSNMFWRHGSPWWIWLSSTAWLLLFVISNPRFSLVPQPVEAEQVSSL